MIYVINTDDPHVTYSLHADHGADVRTRTLPSGNLQVFIQHPREQEVLGTYEGTSWRLVQDRSSIRSVPLAW